MNVQKKNKIKAQKKISKYKGMSVIFKLILCFFAF